MKQYYVVLAFLNTEKNFLKMKMFQIDRCLCVNLLSRKMKKVPMRYLKYMEIVGMNELEVVMQMDVDGANIVVWMIDDEMDQHK